MIMEMSFLGDLREEINAMPNFLFSLKGQRKEDVLNDDAVMEQLWCLYQKSVQDYDCDPDWAARDALKDVFGIPHDDELHITDYALHIRRGGDQGDYYNSFSSLEELRSELSQRLTSQDIQGGLLDRLTTFPHSAVNDDGLVENKHQNISVCAYLG